MISIPLTDKEVPVGGTVHIEADPTEDINLIESLESQKLGDWPYRVVRTNEDLLALGEWLQALGGEVEKTPVGISATHSTLAFATRTQGWFFVRPPLGSDYLTLSQGVLNKALTTERVAPALVTRDTTALIKAMDEWIGIGTIGLLPNVIHDMTALEYTTGRAVARGLPSLKDALDCAAVGPALALETPKFYHKVAMPLVRHNSGVLSPYCPTPLDEQNRWTLTYDHLLFRMLAHYTRDPTLARWFQDSLDPLTMFCQTVDLETRQAISFLLWLICGEDEALVARLYPNWVSSMPEAPQLIRVLHVDKKLVNFRLGLVRLIEEYTAGRRAQTLYGRHSPWGLRPGELLHFAIMGSVCDILDVTVASLLKHGSENHWLIPASDTHYPHWLRAQVVGYNEREPMEWQREVEELGQLGDPLGQILLEGKVSVG